MACSALIDKTNRNGLVSRMSFPGNFSAGMLGWQSRNFNNLTGSLAFGLDRMGGAGQDLERRQPILWTLGIPFPCITLPAVERTIVKSHSLPA